MLCFFGSKAVLYLGFVLTQIDRILPGEDKLKPIQWVTSSKTVTEIKALLRLCNFFTTQIKKIGLVALWLLYGLNRNDKNALAFTPKKKRTPLKLWSKHSGLNMSWPIQLLIGLLVDTVTGTAKRPGWVEKVLTQIGDKGNIHAISYATRHLVTHEKNYISFGNL